MYFTIISKCVWYGIPYIIMVHKRGLSLYGSPCCGQTLFTSAIIDLQNVLKIDFEIGLYYNVPILYQFHVLFIVK